MVYKLYNRIYKPYKIQCSLITIFLLYLLGIQLSEDYGISWDENVRRIGAKSHAKEVCQFFGIKHDIFQNIPSVKENNHSWTGPYGMIYEFPALIGEAIIGSNNTKAIFELRHKIIFTFHFIGILAFFLLAKEIFKSTKKSLFATFIYSMHPRIFAHSFFNPKDIIFLALVSISLFLISKYFNSKNIKWLIYSSVFIGFSMSSRIVGIYLPFLFAATIILKSVFYEHGKINTYTQSTLKCISILLVSFITMFVVTPYYWNNTIPHFIETFEMAKNFPWLNNVFFFGKNTPAPELPWYYLIVSFLITTPLINIFFFDFWYFYPFSSIEK